MSASPDSGGPTRCVLIIEDEPDLIDTMRYAFEREGYTVLAALTGAGGIEKATSRPRPDVVLLDLMLPDLSGKEVCRQIRSRSDVPIIMVTARGEEIDRVVGLELGADDYVVKPFSVRELLLRARAILRRTTRAQASDEAQERRVFGTLEVDTAGHRAWVEGREIHLTALEFRLLVTLMERKGRVQTREVLLTDVWEMSPELTTRTVDTHVKRLREKLSDAATYVETVRGVGYRFREAP